MAVYLMLLLTGAQPQAEPVIARDIHARRGSAWEATQGLVDDRPPPLGYALPDEASLRPSLDYDLSGFGKWDKGRKDRAEVAFEEAIDMAREAREEVATQSDSGRAD